MDWYRADDAERGLQAHVGVVWRLRVYPPRGGWVRWKVFRNLGGVWQLVERGESRRHRVAKRMAEAAVEALREGRAAA